MKKVLLGLVLVLGTLSSFSQTKTTPAKVYQLLYESDKMEDKEYLSTNYNLVALKTSKSGFWITPDFEKDTKTNLWKYNGLTGMAAGIGLCHENDYLIILFEDGTKVRTDMWNEFNCNGDFYLDWDKELENDLRTKPIKKIRLTNGRSFDSWEKEYIKAEDKNYFIIFFKKLDEFNKKIK
jgi:hypothetical protein